MRDAIGLWEDGSLGWKAFLESARRSAREIEALTFRIDNGGSDWSASGAKVRSTTIASPTENAALMALTVVPQLIERRDAHINRVGMALAAVQDVRERLGATEGEILEMFYIDGFLTWEIAAELDITVDGVFYRKRKALAWMDENLPLPE